MNKKLKDSSGQRLTRPSMDMSMESGSVKFLDTDETRNHYHLLSKNLHLLSQLVYEKIPHDGGRNNDFQNFLQRLGDTLDVLILKNEVDSRSANQDVRLLSAIDPSDSGFPAFARDVYFLGREQEKAVSMLQQIPSDEKLARDAVFHLFSYSYPRDAILAKRTREYYQRLSEVELPNPIKAYPLLEAGYDGNFHRFKKSVERLDDHHNLPRFYTFYLQVPQKSFKKSGWKEALYQAAQTEFSVVTELELGHLARNMEAIEGVQIQMIERFDIGPFYSKYTDNKGAIKQLIDGGDDDASLIVFRQYRVLREGQIQREGFWDGFFSGDNHQGYFTQPIESPAYILLPHQFIQQIHHDNLNLELGNTQMFGVTKDGDLID